MNNAFYYEVLVAGSQYHGKGALVYSSAAKLQSGSIVNVALRDRQALAVVCQRTVRPTFATKPLQVLNLPPLPRQLVELISWLAEYYPAPLGTITQQFLPSRISEKSINHIEPVNLNAPKSTKLPPPTTEQQQTLDKINKPRTYVLHGETGSGKTRVYQELAKRSIDSGKSVIILTPEISLTSQLYKLFQEVFGNRVILAHSQLKGTERVSTWLQALSCSNQPLIVIGARSALFAPLKKVGLIVVDEAHELAYKQESAPHYHAIRVASKLAELHGATTILGSATPAVTDYFVAEQKNIPILRMQSLAIKSNNKISVQTVDMKDLSKFTHSKYISDALIESTKQALAKNEQILMFLNRRGTARVILCSSCGWQAVCPNCGVPLTYHGDSHSINCHVCGYKKSAPLACPTCGNSDIILKGVGTKAIVEELHLLFPEAKVQRFDTDNKKSERFEQHYSNIREGSIDILVGTQTLAKGLDLPRLSVVGVINADTSLSIPDYTAHERLYQLISQVLGRVGRGHRNGKAIVQTYHPKNNTLQAAINKNWREFYSEEIASREKFLYPPFCYILKLSCKRASNQRAGQASNQLVEKLQRAKLKIEINGPSPSFHEKQSGKYVWQIIVKSKGRQELLRIISLLPSGWTYDIDPANLL